MRIASALALTAALFMAGTAWADGQEAEAETPSLAGTHWLLTELDGSPAAEGVETTLIFAEDGSLGGNGGCNTYGGNVSFEGETGIDISEVFSTMMACPEPRMSQEQAYFAALEAAVSYGVADDTLTLYGAGDAPLAVLAAQPAD